MAMHLVRAELAPRMERPRQELGWRKTLTPYFGTIPNAVITIVCVALIALFAHDAFRWLLVDLVFSGGPAAGRRRMGPAGPSSPTNCGS